MSGTSLSSDLDTQSTVPIEELQRLAEVALVEATVSPVTANRVAAVLVDAEARGISSHGLVRLPSYISRIRAELVNPDAEPQTLRSDGACVLIDGKNAFGAVAAELAMTQADQRARHFGVSWISVIHSNHLGAIGYYVRKLARCGLIAMMWSNAAPSVAAYQGRRPILGTNPIALAAPRDPHPVVLDMATSAVARGRIRRAVAEGRSIPTEWAVAPDGRSTTDPVEALSGALLPLGGAKGYGLSVFIELLSSVLGGGASLDQVYETTEITKPADIAFTLIAVDPEHFVGSSVYAALLENFTARLKASGDGGILLPGELEDRAYARSLSQGIAVAPDIMLQFTGDGHEPRPD